MGPPGARCAIRACLCGTHIKPFCFHAPPVDAALKGLPADIIAPYLDDILVATSGDFKDHIDTVGKVFEKLIAAGFTVRCDKIHLAKRETGYLGFLVGAYGTRPEPKKTQPIHDMKISMLQTDPSAPARFAGMIGFYQRFIENCSYMLIDPFYNLRQKDAKFSDVVTHFVSWLHSKPSSTPPPYVNAIALAPRDETMSLCIASGGATLVSPPQAWGGGTRFGAKHPVILSQVGRLVWDRFANAPPPFLLPVDL